jgi:hypothetical protein
MGHVKKNPTWQSMQAGRAPQQKRLRGGTGSGAFKKYLMIFFIVAFLFFTSWELFLYINDTHIHATGSQTAKPTVASSTPHVFESENSFVFRPPTPTPTPTPTHFKRPDFEAGIIFPQWTPDGYGTTNWQQQLPAVQTQSGARWIELTVFLSQATPNSTQVRTNPSTPTIQSFVAGIRAAHNLGFRVFVVPLMGVDSPAHQWSGTIQFSNYQDETLWFDSYWKTYQPFVAAAAQNGVEQMAIGTELVWLEQNAPADLWNTLITRVHSVFPGPVTYDMNWSSLAKQPLSWMSNKLLAAIGVSEYLPLVNNRIRVDPKYIPGLWKTIVKSAIDNFSVKVGKSLIISEIGYRNSADTLFDPWAPNTTFSPPDPVEQAAACDAALVNVIPDQHITGIFFWGWDGVGGFKLSGQPALGVLKKWYMSPLS